MTPWPNGAHYAATFSFDFDAEELLIGENPADGHEVAHHDHSQTNPTQLSHTEERAELAQGLAALDGFGADVVGYRSPSWEFTPHTLDLLAAAGLQYSSNLLDYFLPYRHESHDLVEVSVSWILARRSAMLS